MRFRWIRITIQIGIGAIMLLWLFQLANISKVFSTLLNVNSSMLIIALLFFITASTCVALAVYVSFRPLGIKASLRKVVMGCFAGQLLSDITPARAGFFATPLILNRLCNIQLEKGMAAVLATGVINSFVRVVLAGVATIYFLRFLPLNSTLVNALIIGILSLLALGIILLVLLLEKRILRLKMIFEKLPLMRDTLFKILDMFGKAQDEGQRIKRVCPHIALLILASIIVNAIALYFICKALGLNSPSLVDFIFMAGLISSLMYIPITIAGLGVQETGYVLILTLYGIPFEIAVAFALLARILFTGTDAIGFPILIKVGFDGRFKKDGVT